jgi:hypothetical protein
MKFLISFAILIVAALAAEKARFDNYRVYKVYVDNKEQYDALMYLEENSDSVRESFSFVKF